MEIRFRQVDERLILKVYLCPSEMILEVHAWKCLK